MFVCDLGYAIEICHKCEVEKSENESKKDGLKSYFESSLGDDSDKSSIEESDFKKIITEVSSSMNLHGYDAINQIVGYLISNDLGYIPEYDDNRNKIAKYDRTVILEHILREYLK